MSWDSGDRFVLHISGAGPITATLGHGIYARREVGPACQVADLPSLDLIVLSHYHGDHVDDEAARDLDKDVPIISTDHAIGQLTTLGFGRGHALDTWQDQAVEKGDARLVITAMPAKHATDDALAAMLMPVNGHMLDFSLNGELPEPGTTGPVRHALANLGLCRPERLLR